MKKVVIFSILALLFVGASSCKKSEKSNACDIESFTVNGEQWNISGLVITKNFPKGANVSNLSPSITFSKGATVTPNSGVAQNFSSPVTYIVTAEDGKTTKTYTASAIVATE